MQMCLLRNTLFINRVNIVVIFITSVLLAGFIALGGFRITSDFMPQQQYQLALNILPVIVLFGSSVLLASSFNPNQQQIVELHASQPYPYWKVVRDQAYVSFGVVACASLGYLGSASLLTQQNLDPQAIVYWVGSTTLSVSCIGILLLAIAYGRDGRIGYITGAVLFLIMSQAQLPDNLLLFAPSQFQAEYLSSIPWWLSRIVYIVIGLGCGMLALNITANTDFLLLGTARPAPRRHQGAENRHQPGLMQGRPRLMAMMFYQTHLIMIQGIIPIIFLVGMLYYLISMYQSLTSMSSDSATYTFLLNINTISQLLALFLPLLLIDITQRDRESGLLEVLLTIASPAGYLAYRALGIAGALMISLVISVALPYGIGMVVLVATNLGLAAKFTEAFVGMLLLGLLPRVLYLGVMSFLVGAILHDVNRFLLRIGALLITIFLSFSLSSSVIGNIFYPTGAMASITTQTSYQQFLSVIFISDGVQPETIVNFPVLLLPLLSACVQIIMIGFVSARLFEYTTRRS